MLTAKVRRALTSDRLRQMLRRGSTLYMIETNGVGGPDPAVAFLAYHKGQIQNITQWVMVAADMADKLPRRSQAADIAQALSLGLHGEKPRQNDAHGGNGSTVNIKLL